MTYEEGDGDGDGDGTIICEVIVFETNMCPVPHPHPHPQKTGLHVQPLDPIFLLQFERQEHFGEILEPKR